jgi:hypothetical protein
MKLIAGLLIVLALLIGIVPQFTDCEAQGRQLTLANGKQIPMMCHWTARAELVAAGALIGLAGLMATSRRRETIRALSIIGLILGLMVILLPIQLIGVCANEYMLCKMLMQPMLIFAGTLVAASSMVTLLMAVRERTETLSTASSGI